MSFIEVFSIFSISLSVSIKLNFNLPDKTLPIVDFPDPIIPTRTKFFLNIIRFYIEKSQICLNLKLHKFICNFKKIQEQGQLAHLVKY